MEIHGAQDGPRMATVGKKEEYRIQSAEGHIHAMRNFNLVDTLLLDLAGENESGSAPFSRIYGPYLWIYGITKTRIVYPSIRRSLLGSRQSAEEAGS